MVIVLSYEKRCRGNHHQDEIWTYKSTSIILRNFHSPYMPKEIIAIRIESYYPYLAREPFTPRILLNSASRVFDPSEIRLFLTVLAGCA